MKDAPRFSRGYLAYALALIAFANFLDYLDRTVVLTFEKEIHVKWGVSGGHFGALWTAFTLGYMLFSPGVGYLADRHRRTRLLAGCLFIWSLATAACGIVQSYELFLLNRLFVGIGEAGAIVIGPPLLADYFSRGSRGKALAVFYLGMPVGGACGFVVGGLFGWPDAFFVAGIPGCLLAVNVFFLREPERGASENGGLIHAHAVPSANLRSYKELLKTRTLLYTILALAFASFVLVPLMVFGTGFFESRGLSKKQTTIFLAVLALGGGLIGNFTGGFLGDRLGRRHPGAYALLAAGGYTLAIPCIILGANLFPSPVAYPLFFLAFTSLFMCLPLVNTQIANVVSPGQRSVAFAATLFLAHLFGDMPSAPLFGAIKDAASDQLAFTIFPLALVLSTYFCWRAYRSARRDTETFRRRIEETRLKVRPPE